MPTRYRCSDCHLGFETGWYHYHREMNRAMAATFLVCAKCGSAYMLDHKYDGSRDELNAWGGPVTWVPTEYKCWYKNAPGTSEMAVVPCDHDFRPIRKEMEWARMEGVVDELNLSGFPCFFCRAVGGLTNQWPQGKTTCPRCSKETLQVVGCYIT
jgi:hypothetical protein